MEAITINQILNTELFAIKLMADKTTGELKYFAENLQTGSLYDFLELLQYCIVTGKIVKQALKMRECQRNYFANRNGSTAKMFLDAAKNAEGSFDLMLQNLEQYRELKPVEVEKVLIINEVKELNNEA